MHDGSQLPETDAVDAAVDTGGAGRARWRRRLLLAAGSVFLLAAGAYGVHWFLVGRYFQTTDDAYLQADSAVISPQIAGYITEVAVADNESVDAGQVLARIDDRDYRAELARCDADVASATADVHDAEAQVLQQSAKLTQGGAQIASASAQADYAHKEVDRFQNLIDTGAISMQKMQQAQADLKRATAAVDEAEASLEGARQQVTVLQAKREKAEAGLQHAEATREAARLRLSYTVVTATEAGVVGDRTVRVGQFVQSGTRLMTVVPVKGIYLVANFKETQLRHIRHGEPVQITLDAYPDDDLSGTVDSLSPGTGAQFALLPSENATGNFTKIVQRVPVKILLDQKSLADAELRPGLSATATVDTRSGRHRQQ